jgi:hypothetical protein
MQNLSFILMIQNDLDINNGEFLDYQMNSELFSKK